MYVLVLLSHVAAFFFVHIFSFRLNSLWSFPVGKFKKLTSEDGMQPPSEPRLQDADGPCDMNGDSLKQLQSTANYWQKKHTRTRHVQHHYCHVWLLLLFL